jgi:hypothetical protein
MSAVDDTELIMAFETAVGADAAARYEAVSAEDRDRIRLWSGQPINPTDRLDIMPLFLRSVVYRVATQDATLLRAVCRRINLLDSIDGLPSDQDLLDRAEKLVEHLPPSRRRRAKRSSPHCKTTADSRRPRKGPRDARERQTPTQSGV